MVRSKRKRVNITMDEFFLSELDEYADRWGQTRSDIIELSCQIALSYDFPDLVEMAKDHEVERYIEKKIYNADFFRR